MAYFLICLFLCVSSLDAKDFGTQGHLFSIDEEDFLEVLKVRMKKLPEEEIRAYLIEKIRSPIGKEWPEVKNYRVYYFDPSVSASKDVLDHEGNVIVAKGSTVNPLAILPMQTELLFFDGSNDLHIEWAQKYPSAKWILVKGRPLDFDRPVYFDYSSVLASKLKIKRIPARVTAENLRLKIEEIPCAF